ncbi:PAS domain-containing sensor histidine kinase [Haloferax sp. Atlit-4N]|uniref:PAS domain-containing protein n=1 Tax=Haloferax sp. Atlit-4N TaxID=2077206 RepID=UPI000E2219F7|nr:PAS domain-containing sensor histidine kinase [Haloferax sp. Atlit-4N]RDZ50176.1 PAS domain-containing sensor histidine kinase [Haloferax sp. Atlit-4N]
MVQHEALNRVIDGTIIVDSEFRYASISQQAEQILGTDTDDVLNKRLWETFPDLTETAVEEKLREAMNKQIKYSFDYHEQDLDRWFDIRVCPNDDGLLMHFIDITDRKQYELELERKNRCFSTLLENTSECVYIKNKNGSYNFVNEAAAAVFDTNPDEVVGKTDKELFDSADASAVQEVDERIAEFGEAETREAVRHVNGERHVFLDNKFPYRNEKDDIVGIMGISRDITDRNTREQELERQEYLFGRVQEIADIGVWEYNPRTDDLTWSDGIKRIHGVENSYEPTLEDALEFYHPEDRDKVEAAVENAIENGERYDLFLRIVRTDGETRHIRAYGEAGLEEHSDKQLVQGVFQDVTERQRREQALRELGEEYEALINNAEDAFFFVNVEHVEDEIEFQFDRLSPSHEATSGLTTGTIQGKSPQEVFGDVTGAEIAENYRRCVEAGEPITYEESLPTPEGDIIWQTKLAPVVINGEVTRIVGVARDVTDRVEREQKLHRQKERLDEFASVVSHDLRSPLNVAQGRAELLKDESASEHLDPLSKALDRMETIIEDTLTLARQGNSVAEMQPIKIADMAEQCWGLIETTDATLEVFDDITIQGDPDRLQHICENLFRNAVEHGGKNVSVRIGRAGEKQIYFEDDGIGIPPAKRDAVFEPGHSSASGGTGFGLSIVKRIAEAHGWSIAIAESSDGGARFEFSNVEIND